jgi:hypothetical protein
LTEHLPAPPQIGFSSQDSSIQPWAADFLDSVQAASSICPSLAPDLFGSLQDLAAAPELTMALLDQQAMAQVDPALPAGPAWSQAAMEGFSGQWPRQDVLWWQRPMPSGEEDAAWQRLHRGLPMLQQAFQRQASTTCQVIEPETESYLFTPDGLWLAQVLPQQQIIEVALQSWLFGPDETFFGAPSVGQSFRLSASRAFAEPILVSYTANCGPGGGSSSLVVVNTQTGEVVKPALSPDDFQLVFRITEAGTYRLASTAGW